MTSMPSNDLDRLRAEYAERERHHTPKRKYSGSDAAHNFMIAQRRRDLGTLLRREGFGTLQGRRVLEVGCGDGGVLRELLGYGASESLLHGTDLLFNRTARAHERLPGAGITCADGQQIPYSPGSFDMALQFTVFSSVLDFRVRERMAQEMLRVLKGDGLIVWYDFWLNPLNTQTRGIRLAQIRRLFPGCHFSAQRVTLAPPLVRLVAPYSMGVCALLERLKVFNSHFLVAIRKVT